MISLFNAHQVVLAGHMPAGGRNRGVLCRAERIAHIVAGKDKPGYGARNIRSQLVLRMEYHCSVFHTSGPKD